MTREAELIESLVPLIADLAADGNGAVALAGSRGKGRSDEQSDYDFRVYAEAYRGPAIEESVQWARFEAEMHVWRARGFRMDGVWMRRYAGVERDLSAWLEGTAVPKTFEWTIWGYHLPTDLANQRIVHDPHGTLGQFRRRLETYPETMRSALIGQHRAILRYWADDYHYQSKVGRHDLVFLFGLTAKLVHSILQIVFALNRVYFPGDGWNLPMAGELAAKPDRFVARIEAILAPGEAQEFPARQRLRLIEMIGDIEALVREHGAGAAPADHQPHDQDQTAAMLVTEERPT